MRQSHFIATYHLSLTQPKPERQWELQRCGVYNHYSCDCLFSFILLKLLTIIISPKLSFIKCAVFSLARQRFVPKQWNSYSVTFCKHVSAAWQFATSITLISPWLHFVENIGLHRYRKSRGTIGQLKAFIVNEYISVKVSSTDIARKPEPISALRKKQTVNKLNMLYFWRKVRFFLIS